MGHRIQPVKSSERGVSIPTRLLEVRAATGLDLRGFATDLLKRVGYDVSHASVMGYEKDTAMPAAYVAAVCVAYALNPAWLLLGELPKERQPPDEAAKKLAVLRGLIDATTDDWARVERHYLEIVEEEGSSLDQ